MDKAQGKYHEGPVPQSGLTALFEPVKPTLE